ncbi:MAG: hypothetical protein OXU20_32115 [Myxococcales bacterium]|nr:hypothetical protein [Myxococcales bacterium]
MGANIEIQIPDRELISKKLATDQPVTVGRSASGGLAVPDARQFEREHFIVEPRARGCHVMILPGANHDATLKGREFTDGLVAWGDTLLIGQVQVRFTQGGKGPSLVLILGPAVIVAMVVFLLTQNRGGGSLSDSMPEAPALAFSPQECFETGVAARVRAEELEEQALASAERYAFDLTDGMDAAQLFLASTACYVQSGDRASAVRTEKSHEVWRTRLSERYAAHRLRLRVALDRGQPRVAEQQLTALLQFLSDFQEHPYHRWLGQVNNQLRLALMPRR